MTLQQVLSQVRRAADDYEMIQDGDKIAVGISGGKDSLTLLYALSTLRRFYPHPFELHAVTVDLGFENLNLGKIEALCKELEADVIGFVHKHDVPVVKSPCPADGHTRREYVKQLLRQLNLENPGVKDRMFTAVQSGLAEWRVHEKQ